MKPVLEYKSRTARPRVVWYESWPRVLFLLAIFFSWAPFYVSIAETFRSVSYPFKWFDRQPILVGVIWLCGIPARPILFFLALFILVSSEVRKDWPGKLSNFVFLVATLTITTAASAFDWCESLWYYAGS